jgi:hypothetical protein
VVISLQSLSEDGMELTFSLSEKSPKRTHRACVFKLTRGQTPSLATLLLDEYISYAFGHEGLVCCVGGWFYHNHTTCRVHLSIA